MPFGYPAPPRCGLIEKMLEPKVEYIKYSMYINFRYIFDYPCNFIIKPEPITDNIIDILQSTK